MKNSIDKFFIGSLFRFYREENKVSRTSLIKSNKTISLSTIRRIEEGKYSSFSMYETLSKELGLKISNNHKLYLEMNSYIEQTYKIINSGNFIDKYVLLRNQISNFYKANKKYLYLSELSRICIATLNMYLTCAIDDLEIIDICKNIVDYVDSNSCLHTLICYLLYLYGRYYSKGNNRDGSYFEYSKFLINKQIFALEDITYNSLILSKFDFLRKYDSYMTSSIKKNDNYLLKRKKLILNSYHCFLSNDFKGAVVLLNNLINDQDIKKRIPNRAHLNHVKDLAYAYLKMQDYENSLKCFLIIIDFNPNIIGVAYANIFMMCDNLNKKDLIKTLLDSPPNLSSSTVDNIFKYFKLKINNNVSYKELEEFIIKNFGLKSCNSLQCYGTFKNEMSLLVDKSHNYKSFYRYLKENDPYINTYKISDSVDFREEDFLDILI